MPRQEIQFTDEHINMLESRLNTFRQGDPDCRDEEVEKAADDIERTWTEDVEFDRDTVISVRKLIVKLGHSQIQYF